MNGVSTPIVGTSLLRVPDHGTTKSFQSSTSRTNRHRDQSRTLILGIGEILRTESALDRVKLIASHSFVRFIFLREAHCKYAMATNHTFPPLPNPFTPLAFLPPTIADQFQISIYLFIGTLAVSMFCIIQVDFGWLYFSLRRSHGIG